MTRSVLPLLALVLLVPTVGSAPKLKDGPGDTPYFPARVGMKWVYDQAGQESVLEISGVKSEAGKTVVTIFRGPAGSVSNTYVITSDAVLDCGSTRFRYDPPPKSSLPLTPGDSWDYEELLAADGLRSHTGKMTVGKEETVEVPAGKLAALPVVREVTASHRKAGVPATNTVHAFWYATTPASSNRRSCLGGRVLKSSHGRDGACRTRVILVRRPSMSGGV